MKERIPNKPLAVAVAIAVGTLATPAMALEIGQPSVRSALGERLLLEVPLSDAAALPRDCISARFPSLRKVSSNIQLKQTANALIVTTRQRISVPVLDFTILVDCPNSAMLQRDFTVFIDPVNRVSEADRQLSTLTLRADIGKPATRSHRPTRRAAIVRSTSREPIIGTRYAVQRGDSASKIAMRLTAPGEDIWPVIDQLVADNPDAFVGNDPNRLLAGATLALPVTATVVATQAARVVTQSADIVVSEPSDEPPPPPPPAAPAVETRVSAVLDVVAARQQELAQTRLPEPQVIAEQSLQSPFRTQPTIPATETLSAIERSDQSAQTLSIWAKVGGVLLGMAAMLVVWLLGQMTGRASERRRRAAEAAAPLFNHRNQTTVSGAPAFEPTVKQPRLDQSADFNPALVSPTTAEPDYEVASMAVPTNTSAVGARVADRMEATSIEVSELFDIEDSELMQQLDATSLALLEKDYEIELTHTQKLNKDIAARALGLPADEEITLDDTVNLTVERYADPADLDATAHLESAVIDDTTVAMPPDESLLGNDIQEPVVVSDFTNTMTEIDVNSHLPVGSDGDLDFDMTSTLVSADGAAADDDDKTAVMPENTHNKKRA